MNPKVKAIRRELYKLQLRGESDPVSDQRRRKRIEELQSRLDRAMRAEKPVYNPERFAKPEKRFRVRFSFA